MAYFLRHSAANSHQKAFCRLQSSAKYFLASLDKTIVLKHNGAQLSAGMASEIDIYA